MEDILIPKTIIRCKRRSIALIIDKNADLIVRAPIKSSDKEILKFILEKQNWIRTKKQEISKNTIPSIKVVEGEKIKILDKTYTIIIGESVRVKCVDSLLLVPKENSKERVIAFLKKTLSKHIKERADLISNQFGFEYDSITINSAKGHWGSCSASNKLHFTYRLALCPTQVIDYIIIHELCHTKVKNHSIKFWRLVKSICPNYKNYNSWLKENRSIMNVI